MLFNLLSPRRVVEGRMIDYAGSWLDRRVVERGVVGHAIFQRLVMDHDVGSIN
jgi:hypothetical protein